MQDVLGGPSREYNCKKVKKEGRVRQKGKLTFHVGKMRFNPSCGKPLKLSWTFTVILN